MSTRVLFPTAIPAFNAPKFHARLVELGLQIEGVTDCVSTGGGVVEVDFIEPPTQAQIDLVAAELAAHDPVDHAAQVAEAALSQAASIPQWAHWTEAQALAWHDENIAARLPISNLSQANAVLAAMNTELRALVRLYVALRNRFFPGLQE